MEQITKLAKFCASPFKQDIELQQIDLAGSFVALRIRIREGNRFTVFDIDETTAECWAQAMLRWADTQRRK